MFATILISSSRTVSEDFVRSQLRNLKPGKTVGLDNIPARLLIDAADIVAKPLTQIINLSLQSGTVPKDWRAAQVVHLFKQLKRRLKNWSITVRFPYSQ